MARESFYDPEPEPLYDPGPSREEFVNYFDLHGTQLYPAKKYRNYCSEVEPQVWKASGLPEYAWQLTRDGFSMSIPSWKLLHHGEAIYTQKNFPAPVWEPTPEPGSNAPLDIDSIIARAKAVHDAAKQHYCQDYAIAAREEAKFKYFTEQGTKLREGMHWKEEGHYSTKYVNYGRIPPGMAQQSHLPEVYWEHTKAPSMHGLTPGWRKIENGQVVAVQTNTPDWPKPSVTIAANTIEADSPARNKSR